ncbi:MAG TPA: response regulator transcription factor [Solirubrobacteraceae bacterium]|nr:response regulator transcription factor [Solirubrobacteraceae bacterium]
MSVERIRVVVGEDEYLIREALQKILAGVADIDVVRFAADADSLLAAVEEEEPDAVLTDIRMPPTHTDEGIRVAQTLRTSHPSIGVVVLSQFADPDYALALLDAGSAGRAYLLKERVSAPGELIAAIEAVVEGGSVIDPKVVEVLVRARSLGAQSPLATLTPREREVLAELAQGKSNAAIASSLVLTKRAVEKHINSIFLKLELPSPDDVSRRVKAALLFLASGESQPPVNR